jgi:8-oxo-dGTP diphosphatase
MTIPVFGTRIDGRAYVRRPSAYALVRNGAGEWALVRTPQGCFLPGGGMELHETSRQTVERESREECGFVLRSGRVIARAIQFVYSSEKHEYFEKICDFVEAELIDMVAPVEDDHELIWLDLDEALKFLSHESQRWAIARAGGRV